MKKFLTLLFLGLFIIGYSAQTFAVTSETNSRPQPPQFENGNPNNLNSNNKNFSKGKMSQKNGENQQNEQQFDNRRPKYKPDSQPGGKMTPKEWDTSSASDNNFQGGQPPQMKEGLKNGLKDGLKNGTKNGLKNGYVNGTQKSE